MIDTTQRDILVSQKSFNATHATLSSHNMIGNAERRCVHSSHIPEIKMRSSPTPELTGREHTAFNIIGEEDDERDAIERSG